MLVGTHLTLTSVRQLQSWVVLGFTVRHDSAGDLKTLIQSARSGIRKEVDQHMDYLDMNMLNTRQNINFSARWFDFGNAHPSLFKNPKRFTLEIPNKNPIKYTTSGPRTSLDGWL